MHWVRLRVTHNLFFSCYYYCLLEILIPLRRYHALIVFGRRRKNAVNQLREIVINMESGSSVVGKPHKKQKANEVDDIISNKLPESLISRILSFLPTKDAVRTGVLSKRWIYRWTTITKLDLNDSVFYSPKRKTGGKQHFVNFVNRALLLTSVESFSLVIANHKYDESLLNTWISSILNRRVRNLRIVSNSELIFSAFTLHSLLKSWYLEELVLHMCCGIKVPAHHVCFGHLKLLKLCGIIFAIVSSSYDSYQSLNLPVLKRFETKNCLWLSKKSVTVTVEAPLLESVFIEQDLESVSHELHSCAITFSALHLKEFTYSGYGVSGSITLSKPSSAHNASANIVLKQSGDIVPETGSCAFNLLKQFSQAKCIKFDGSKVLTQSNMAVLPLFAKLSQLELSTVTGKVLLGLLQRSPVLKNLVLKGISKFDVELLNSVGVPECLASTLQVVKFEKVTGVEYELLLAKFLMENGTMLERISFSTAGWLCRSKVMEEFKEKLFSFKKAFSNFAIVDFSA